jgi:hypothetical protein
MVKFRNLVLLALVSTGAACASSSFNSTWKNPEAQPAAFKGKKVLAVVQVKEEGLRRAAEDALAAEITKRGATGVASYTIFPSSAAGQDTAAARVKATQAGIAGLVLMSFTGKETSVTSTPTYSGMGYVGSPYYRNPYGAWGYGWSTAYVSQTVQTDTKVLVETRVYSLEQGRLLWAGSSETWNPSKSTDVVKDLSAAVARKLQEAELIKP